MTNKVIVEVEMLDSKKSLDNLDAGAKRANKTLERTQQLMAGTKGGSRSANAAFQQTEYNTARGTVGTGAAGRDFAKQSRELGGLVRLYATYAATLYATEAAFRALSQAMDTTNMIEGLNQLGAANGVAMGGLAKRFAGTAFFIALAASSSVFPVFADLFLIISVKRSVPVAPGKTLFTVMPN